MVNTLNFGKRIQEIMKFNQLSASGFADAMGVGRSSISHILSGRNKPSLDFVMKITEAYPEAELQWLLYGKGNFPVSSNINEPIIDTVSPPTPISPIPKETPKNITAEQDLFTQSKPDISAPIPPHPRCYLHRACK